MYEKRGICGEKIILLYELIKEEKKREKIIFKNWKLPDLVSALNLTLYW